jgi:hypothetical protein
LDNLHVKNNDDNTNKSLKLLLTSKKRKNALDDNKAANTLSSINKKKSKLLHDESFYKKLLLDSGIDIENEVEEEIEEEDLDDRIKLEEKLLANCEIVDLSSIIENDDGIEKIRDDGVIRINNVLSSNTCKQLLDVITNELKESIHAIESGEVDVFERFSSLLSNQNRFDLKLPMNNVIFNAIKELVNPNKDLGRTIKALVGKDSELFELASFYSKSKSSNQCIHSDTIHTKKSILFTITIALQDIDVDMGPTLFFPRTHKKLYHNKFYHEGSESRNKIVSERYHCYYYSLLYLSIIIIINIIIKDLKFFLLYQLVIVLYMIVEYYMLVQLIKVIKIECYFIYHS